jgi:Rrf2 family transcriptional regulator, cysteine metabolism repressor
LGGGYRLKRPAKNISISEILNLLEGPIAPTACLKGKSCKFAPNCGHRKIMERLTLAFNKTLSSYSLASLANS